jgi:hypothetical protein
MHGQQRGNGPNLLSRTGSRTEGTLDGSSHARTQSTEGTTEITDL